MPGAPKGSYSTFPGSPHFDPRNLREPTESSERPDVMMFLEANVGVCEGQLLARGIQHLMQRWWFKAKRQCQDT